MKNVIQNTFDEELKLGSTFTQGTKANKQYMDIKDIDLMDQHH